MKTLIINDDNDLRALLSLDIGMSIEFKDDKAIIDISDIDPHDEKILKVLGVKL